MRLPSLAIGLLAFGCSASSSSSSGQDGGTADTASSTTPKEDLSPDGRPLDGGDTLSDAAPEVVDASALDGSNPTGSRPPQGSWLCGSGTFNPTQAKDVCELANPYFPPTYNVTKACGAAGFGFTSGVWEAWCSPGSVYLFSRFYNLAGFSPFDTVLVPMGHYEVGNSGGSTNAFLFDNSLTHININLETNVTSTGKSGRLHLLHRDSYDNDAGTTNARRVYGVELAWQ